MHNRKSFTIQTLVIFTTSPRVLSSLKLHLFAFSMFINFFQLMNFTLKFSIFLINQITYFNNIASITFTFDFSNKKQTRLYKLNRRSNTMIGIYQNISLKGCQRDISERYISNYFDNYPSGIWH